MVGDPVSTEDLPQWLKLIVPYLENIAINYDGDSVSDIRYMLTEHIATLHIIGDVGFVILQWGPGTCHIRAAHSFNTKPVNLSKVFNETVEYAKQFNCSKISFTSDRKAFGRFARNNGMYVEAVTYARSI